MAKFQKFKMLMGTVKKGKRKQIYFKMKNISFYIVIHLKNNMLKFRSYKSWLVLLICNMPSEKKKKKKEKVL